MITTLSYGGADTLQILPRSLEQILEPYVNYLTFAIDVAAGLIIGISAIIYELTIESKISAPFRSCLKPIDYFL